MKAMILAAGLGTRLKPFTDHHPKALATVNGRTLLEHNIRYLQAAGIKDVVVNVHHFANQIEDALAAGNGFGSNVTVSDERVAVLETGGGLKKAEWYFEGENAFVVMNVDVVTNLDLSKMIAAHNANKAMATLAVIKRDSSRHLLFDKEMQLVGWQNNKTGEQKTAREGTGRPFAFSGVQIITGGLLKSIKQEGKFSLIDVYLIAAATQPIIGYDHTGDAFLDVGKPESLEKAAELLASKE